MSSVEELKHVLVPWLERVESRLTALETENLDEGESSRQEIVVPAVNEG